MSVFLRRFIENKRNILIVIVTVFICGLLFGSYQYYHSDTLIKDFFKYLFYFNIDGYQNQYQLYVIQGSLFILICTYLSSSYLGQIGIMFLIFLKGIQMSFSIIYVFSTVPLSFFILILLIIEGIIELILCLSMSLMCFHISTYVTLITFYIEENFNIKSMMNYKLNCVIMALILFLISLAFRIYIIPMF